MPTDTDADDKLMKKLIFIYNALNDGWTVSKTLDPNTYMFRKPHLNDESVSFDDYLPRFIEHNFNTHPLKNE